MRPAQESAPASTTPIYDALFAEYRRLFRALPGDRSGEEKLRFEAITSPRLSSLSSSPYHRGYRRDGEGPPRAAESR